MKIGINVLAVNFTRQCCFLILLAFLGGCAHQASVEERSNEWIARPLAELKQAMKSPDSYASKIGWKEKTYPLADGYYAFVEPVGPDCTIHWRINQRDIIVDHRTEGSGCKLTATEEKNLWNLSPKSSRWNF